MCSDSSIKALQKAGWLSLGVEIEYSLIECYNVKNEITNSIEFTYLSTNKYVSLRFARLVSSYVFTT